MEILVTQSLIKRRLPHFDAKAFLINPKLITAVLMLLILGIHNIYAQAPIISYTSPQVFTVGQPVSLSPVNTGGSVNAPGISIIAGGYTDPRGIAVDASGNVYVADVASNAVKELASGASSPIIVGSGFTSPTGVAVDASGNLYVADNGNHAIKKIAAGTGTVSTIFSGGGIYGIALDGHGYIYFTDATNSLVQKIPVGGGTAVSLGTGFNTPTGITLDAAGNVYVTDRGNNAIKKILASDGSTVTLAAGDGNSNGIAVDAAGNVYFADGNAVNVIEITAVGGNRVPVASGLLNPNCVSLDGNNNIFIGNNGHHQVDKLSLNPWGYTISPALPVGLSISSTTGVISGTVSIPVAAKNYSVTALNVAGSGSATVNIAIKGNNTAVPVISYSSPVSFYQTTPITPLAPVNTGGAVLLQNETTIFNFGNITSSPGGIAVDPAGNIYIGNPGVANVTKISADGATTTSLGSGIVKPQGLALDADGNIYVVDANAGAVKKILASDGTTSTIATGLTNPWGIALDGNGYMYVTGSLNVNKIPVTGGAGVVISTTSDTFGVAVASTGDVYVAADNSLIRILTDGTQKTLAIGSSITSVSTDSHGNVYYTSVNHPAIYEIPASGGTAIDIGSFTYPDVITCDKNGQLYIVDSQSSNVALRKVLITGYSILPALPSGLTFNTGTGVISGTPTVTSPSTDYTVTALNGAGARRATINITLKPDTAPIISYSSPQIFTLGQTASLSPANAGGAVVAPAVVTLPGTYTDLRGVAVDASGNAYVADLSNNAVKELAFGASSTITIGSGFSSPTGVAVDASGNVYVADNGNKAIKMIPAGNGTVVTIASGLGGPYGIALDGSGYVYVTEATTSDVKKIPVGGGTAQIIGTGFSTPTGIAVDAAGNVYVTDRGNNAIKKILASNGSTVTLSAANGNPNGVAVDAAGNVYYADGQLTGIIKIAVGGGSITLNSGLSSPACVAVDNQNNIFIGDNGHHLLKKQSLNFGYTISPALPVGLTINNGTGVIGGVPAVKSAAINYTVTAVNVFGSSTATVSIAVNLPPKPNISYSSPHTYTVNTTISPLSPTNTGGAVPTQNTVNTPISLGYNPTGVAVDTSGNVYVAGNTENVVKEILPGGTIITLGSGFTTPTGVAVDASGNVYVVDQGNKAVKKIPAGNGTVVTIASGFTRPYGIALDGSGYMYVTDATSNQVEKIPVGGGTAVTIGTGFNGPTGVAVDAAGNVFVADRGNNAIKEILASNGSTIAIASGQGAPDGVAVDAAGNVYFVDPNRHYITKMTATQGNFFLDNGIEAATGIAVDRSGNIFIADDPDDTYQYIDKLAFGGYSVSPSLPPGLTINPITGVISGVPLSVRSAANYSITAANPYGSSTATVSITVSAGALPSLSYASPNVYPSGVAITPLSPTTSGAGAVGNVTYSSVLSGFSSTGVALDAAGNIYIANSAFNSITEFPANGASPVTLGSGFNNPTGVAVDAAGNVFVADYGNNAVKKIPAGNGAVVTIATGFNGPDGIAVDAAGNIYVSDKLNNQVKKIPAGSSTPAVIGTGFSQPMGVAVDGLGNVYVADYGNAYIKRIVAGTGATVILTGSATNPVGVAVDAAGNVYYVNDYTYALEYSVTTHAVTTLGAGFGTPTAIATSVADPGAIYVIGDFGKTLYEVNPTGGFDIAPQLPAGLSFSSSAGVISGTPTSVSPAKNYTVSAYSPGGRRTANVNIAVVDVHKLLTSLKLSAGTLSPAFDSGTINYTAAVGNGVSSLTVTPSTNVSGATIKVNGTSVASGTASAPVTLSVGANTISTVVTAADGVTTQTYTVVVTRAPSANANLSTLGPSITPLSPTFAAGTTSYTLSVAYKVTSMTVKPITSEPNATMTVNGTALASGTTSASIPLAEGTTTAINVVVTAQDGTTTKTYTITVTRGPSNNASLASMSPSITPLSPTFTPTTTSYTLSVANSKTSMTVKPVTSDVNATMTVNGTANPSRTTSAPIALAVGSNTISVVVTAQDGTTTRTYTITVTRAAGPIANFDDGISVTKPTEMPTLAEDGIIVHQGISPNGDGINDFLQIENINQYPDNKLTIMNRNGQMIYEAKNYDNSTKIFDGHSNKNGRMQLPGTYFYQLEYTVKGVTRHKTGFIVLRY